MNKGILSALTALTVLAVTSSGAIADVFSDAAELGANTGAMAYCGDKFAEDDGDCLGKKLDRGRCTSLRKMLYLKY